MPTYNTNINQFNSNLPRHIKRLLIEYDKPLTQNKIFINKDYLKLKSTKVLFNTNRWSQRPYLFCYDTYSPSEQYLYPLILTINNIKSVHEFTSDNFINTEIITPNITAIQRVLG